MTEQFDDIFAVSESRQHHFIDLYHNRIENYIDWFELDLYGVPIDTDDKKYNEIFEGDYTNAIQIGKLSGCLILCKQMLDNGEDPSYVCDSIDYQLDLAISCLSDPTGPLDNDPFQDIFYIEELEMAEKYDDDELKIMILKSLPEILLNLKNVRPELIAYYPTPLPYEEDIHKKIKRDMAVIAMAEMNEREIAKFTGKEIDESQNEYQLIMDEEQINYVMGRRNPNDSYPESAKNIPIWNLYQRAGFIESGSSRMLYMKTY